ncbi:RsmB/NOP family class I SAM-dependent RNA methyltransferase [Aurantimicrobium sp. MWH-Uga1]|uniref:RsmB/NOP family class I SAM-dependent RNA methyltransferase n=1 Tax=Aurantimicrobium sp. MWH-Uga1 TaxID=2079575 RepID=UPI000DF07770|nr:transcription antitermination factor NusB [Aurantimicrobium sp. MWH-Uga1]AXE54537.1 Ribosomal RNA small subunit methyltransferase B [Aurantimicrobium sp. MWH-Uga1]
MSNDKRPHTKGPRRSRPVTPSRLVAFEVLMAVDIDDAYANLALPAKIKEYGLSSNDAGLATELTYGTLRMQGFYDRVIANAAARDIDTIDLTVLNILRMGAHQLLNMRVSQHAAVDESVNLAEHKASLGAVGFVNAVLRRISRHDLEDWQEFITKDISNADEQLGALYSHPVWIVRALKQSLEAEGRGEEIEKLLSSDNVNPRVTLVELPGFVDTNDDVEGEPTRYSPLGMSLNTGGDPTRFARVREGVVRVQDEGSQLAALVLSRHHDITAGEKWLDMCAGPGGKAALLAAEATLGGAILTANEVIPARADLVRKALAILPDVDVVTGDGVDIGLDQPNTYDRILLDAPCTGLGALRRRPEARWRKSPRDVGDLTALQAQLLTSALHTLKPGGVLAYVTCSPHLAETRAIVEGAFRKNQNVTELDARAVLSDIAMEQMDIAGDTLSVQLWPHRHGTDAMFISLLTKSE